ncbi:DUF2214 family protein [Marinagarivorans algicola]|uniref:DUF2214 family protein n=1 Tax=Marinagarivorans algicola TaxID=1513270 RepID=UPI0006B4968D|nr:DUF2214 family protein [Marinagarivorans algicola]
MIDLLVRYLHFLGIIILASMLVAQHLLYSANINRTQLARLRTLNKVYGAGLGIAFVSGLLLWLAVGKPKVFYSTGGLIHIKLTLFVVLAGLSMVPTLFFIRSAKTLNDDTTAVTPPKYIIGVIRAELTLLVVMPLVAVLMANGA